MANFGLSYIAKVLYSFITIILLVVIYSYITSLEQKGCKCALPPNINFIKGFTIFSIVYLLFTGIISEQTISDNFGDNIVLINKFVDLIFALVFIYYLYEVFRYTRALVNEKCKCSVDSRREIIMIGAVIEFILIFILFILHIIVGFALSTMFTVVKSIEDGTSDLKGAIRDPIGSFAKIPSKINSEINNIKTYVGKTSRELSKIRNLPR
uniref:Uncharacterized protein n=1 Tax=viral metagenome TaxID=1070528 RepID=A0A6C0EPB0_9ZZZZ